jgi:hypothetical protein
MLKGPEEVIIYVMAEKQKAGTIWLYFNRSKKYPIIQGLLYHFYI